MRALRAYVAVIDRFNHVLGRIVMFGIFVLMGILLWSSVSKAFFVPSLWTLEMAQFVMVAYYVLGGPYAMQMGSNVRMDLIYGELSPRRKAWWDAVTVIFLLVYLGMLLWGGIESTLYSFQYGGERSSSAWRPYLWPIKVTMCIGIFLMLLQTLSELAKDILMLAEGRETRDVL
ncbi:TRAP transporter small permease subunit [Roseivivax isoporae]|uniref:TRAP transporter small permease protein n=1 Tax=Roseivivax isoporae LMG 25204 TaxID=1449351 RepID=X7F708_9RHOB|nr:TRAP transporter small permease subunit [Roseivivax isoporae]ETX27869.1 C4-dicarboxylate ABC transporter [Roseivivax isoporae LMG 25204]